ncbi:MAG: LysM peptidoglycan-binding domain-containing protein [Gammaproteobacteria bacterium]|nr:LysM peptidoglycan-binding domain-containing protein [Gammaproteobacteria bacterium]
MVALLAGCASDRRNSATSETPPAHRVGTAQGRQLEVNNSRVLKSRAASTHARQTTSLPVGQPENQELWSQLRVGFAIRDVDTPRLQSEIDWLHQHRDYATRVLSRAAPVLPFILEQTRARGLPTELALLPFVESAFNPTATSRSGAAGLWQFMPATGRQYGLTQDWWADDRRDLIKSTHAALDYLTYLNREVGGDWPLTLAAYNGGLGTLFRAQARNRDKGLNDNFEALVLRQETRHYVPKLLAIRQLVAQPDAFGVRLPVVPLVSSFQLVETGGQIELALAARLAELDIGQLQSLNPALRRWATRPEGPHHLLVPADQAEALRRGLATIEISQRVNWQRHAIARGDSLSTIARRYGTTVAVLRQTNNISGSAIRAGKHLLVPQSGDPSRTTVATTPNCNGPSQAYQVALGDTLWMLSRRHDISLAQLQQCNDLSNDSTLSIGQTLRIPQGTLQVADTRRQSNDAIDYRVRRGDSLSHISRKFGVSVNQLRRWNGLVDDLLQPGDLLKVHPNTT